MEQKYRDRIEKLRKEMKKEGICLYLIPMNDDHGSEYIAGHFKQIAYYSGFTGSAGTLLVTGTETLLWTDGRYFLQAKEELEKSGTKLMKMGDRDIPTVINYIVAYLKRESELSAEQGKERKLGFDGSLISFSYVESLKKAWEETGSKPGLTICPMQDISGKLWEADETDPRPGLEQKPIWRLDDALSGMAADEKLSAIRTKMEEAEQDILILSALDEIAWVLNLRGDDIAYNPVFYSYMVIEKERATVYVIDLPEQIKDYLLKMHVRTKAYTLFYEDIKKMAGRHVWVDKDANYLLVDSLAVSNQIKRAATPVYLKKAIKNETEIAHIKKTHVLDGVAVTKFIYWLKTRVRTGKETATELSAAEKLEEFRRLGEGYIGQSFAPIMAYGPHGAIVHYEADALSDVPILSKSFLLSDTGGHYLTGTTDITRTIVMGELTGEQKQHYTAVLMGNLRLMNATFKKGISGSHLDYVARQPLYELGLDFNHGTGHGVGFLLNVHEGPNAFRLKPEPENMLSAGMVTSDEPGYYLAGRYGIRLENLILCVEKQETAYGTFLGFEPLTFVPFDIEAIDFDMMTETDKKLLDAYHRQVWDKISPYLDEEEKTWLYTQTERDK